MSARLQPRGSPAPSKPSLRTELVTHVRALEDLALAELAQAQGPLLRLCLRLSQAQPCASQTALARNFALSLGYLVFTARCQYSDSCDIPSRQQLVQQLGIDEPFVRELVEGLLDSALTPVLRGRVDKMLAALFGRPAPMGEPQAHRPALHEFPRLLHAIDLQTQRSRGVYYTPDSLVAHMLRRVDETLRDPLDHRAGLASDSLSILDPATGTGTFLVHAIEQIYRSFQRAHAHLEPVALRSRWQQHCRVHLLPGLVGFEILPAPFLAAHLCLRAALARTGFVLQPEDRLNLYLTNALCVESAQDLAQASSWAQAEHMQRCRELKQQRYTVILGNPPYGERSQNLGPRFQDLIAPFRSFAGAKIQDKGAIRFEHAINNDYIKFWGLSLRLVHPQGLVCLLTSRSFLEGKSFRGLREQIVRHFDQLQVLDLQGQAFNTPAPKDESLFNIKAGVAMSLAYQAPTRTQQLCYAKLVGTKAFKIQTLQEDALPAQETVALDKRRYLSFIPTQSQAQEYWDFRPLPEFFNKSIDGIKTSRDGLVLANSREDCLAKIRRFVQEGPSPSTKLGGLDVQQARRHLAKHIDPGRIQTFLYRPFDIRYLYYDRALILSHRMALMPKILPKNAWALVCASRICEPGFSHILAANTLCGNKYSSHNINSRMFPLQLASPDPELAPTPNVKLEAIAHLSKHTDPMLACDEFGHYALALLSAPSYAKRFLEEIRQDFPRLPLPRCPALFQDVAAMGVKLRKAQHLELTAKPLPTQGKLLGNLETLRWRDDQLWLNSSFAIAKVPAKVWTFCWAGYRPLKSWAMAGARAGLARRGHALTPTMIEELTAVITAIAHTIQLHEQIDARIDLSGTWAQHFC